MDHGRTVGLRVLIGFVSPSNTRSIQLVEGLGWKRHFPFPFSATGMFPDMLIFTYAPFGEDGESLPRTGIPQASLLAGQRVPAP
jgi:hypothetical protein